MGYSYSNIQLKKGSLPIDPEKIAEKLAAEYRLKRTESRDDADVTVAIGPENAAPWITIVSCDKGTVPLSHVTIGLSLCHMIFSSSFSRMNRLIR